MLLVIGLDGATWNLIDPWIAEGRLPNLARLRARGAHGPLLATTPPATLPSWTSFATGVNPGKHGIFDFTRRLFGTYEVQFINSTFRRAPSIWRLLSDAGRHVAVLGVPGTYPPEDLNGCMISGFDTPVTTRADDSFVRPRELAALMRADGGFPFADFQEFRVDAGWYEMARDRLLAGIDKKVRLAKSILRRDRWDCFVIVFGESDTAAHHFWPFHDRQSPRFDDDRSTQLGDPILAIYRRLDEAIGELEEAAAPEAVMVLSDHGFGGAGDRALHLNGSLARLGLQQRCDGRSNAWATKLKRLALTAVPPSFQARLFRLQDGKWASRLESQSRFAGIDWGSTRAFSEELNYFPSVWVNLAGREPSGTVAPSDYERVRDDVCAALLSLVDSDTGRPIVRRVWRREELYHGPCVVNAPDLILDSALVDGYSYTCLPTATRVNDEFVRRLDRTELYGGKVAGMGGSHRPEGVFLFTSGRPATITLRIEDCGAIVLTHCQVELPSDFDGQPLSSPSATRCRPEFVANESVYGLDEQREIEERLGALGYLQ